jgi:Signal transduction histidine kinase
VFKKGTITLGGFAMEKGLDIEKVHSIMQEIIGAIDKSKGQLIDIVENAREEHEQLKNELNYIKEDIDRVINDVDRLTIKDKMVRNKLAEVSKSFKLHNEEDIKKAYNTAADVKVELMSASREEQLLKVRRTALELSLKRALKNIQNAEHIVHQVTIAVTYLRGEIMSAIDEMGNEGMAMGIKVLEAQENERMRISRDIHDGPAQQIASIVMKADFCERIARQDIDKGLKELAELKEQSKKALKEVRGIIHDLRPMSLDDLGLNETVETYAMSFSEEAQINVNVKSGRIIVEIESIVKVAVYRLVQELLNNIKKHSKASEVSILLEYGSKYLRLTVVDDGVGFDVESTLEKLKKKHISYGLLGIYDRVKQFNGEIHFYSKIGEGTSVMIKLPVNREVILNE